VALYFVSKLVMSQIVTPTHYVVSLWFNIYVSVYASTVVLNLLQITAEPNQTWLKCSKLGPCRILICACCHQHPRQYYQVPVQCPSVRCALKPLTCYPKVVFYNWKRTDHWPLQLSNIATWSSQPATFTNRPPTWPIEFYHLRYLYRAIISERIEYISLPLHKVFHLATSFSMTKQAGGRPAILVIELQR
jgi:hypothetical protein